MTPLNCITDDGRRSGTPQNTTQAEINCSVVTLKILMTIINACVMNNTSNKFLTIISITKSYKPKHKKKKNYHQLHCNCWCQSVQDLEHDHSKQCTSPHVSDTRLLSDICGGKLGLVCIMIMWETSSAPCRLVDKNLSALSDYTSSVFGNITYTKSIG